MDFTLSKEQEMHRRCTVSSPKMKSSPWPKRWTQEEYFPEETVKKMAKLGMMGIYFPKEYGGAGARRAGLRYGGGGAGQGVRHHRGCCVRPHRPVLRPHL